MEAFTVLDAVAVPIEIAKIDTGMILPGRFQRLPRRPGHADYARVFLHDLRFDASGQPIIDFVLNRPAYRDARILVTGPDFGCGSSREGAAYAVLDFGVRALIGASFGDVFSGNCMQNGILPVVLPHEATRELTRQLTQSPGSRVRIDLPQQRVTAPDGKIYAFEVDPTRKHRLLRGLDDVGVTLEQLPAIETFEARHRAAHPWLRGISPP